MPLRSRKTGARGTSYLAAIVASCLLASCSKSLTAPEPPQPSRFWPTIDFPQAWSHDGQYIAFRREWDSSEGPAGVYLVHRLGGRPRYLAPARWFWPRNLAFSADDRFLVGVDNLQLILIDTVTGAAGPLFYTEHGADYPTWSPDSAVIAYSRVFSTSGSPMESLGIHLFNLDTRTDVQWSHDGQPVGGTHLAWSPEGDWIALIQHLSGLPGRRVALLEPDGGTLRPAWQPDTMTFFDRLAWYHDGVLGLRRLSVHIGRTSYLVDIDGGTVQRYTGPKGYGLISPDGQEIVRAEFNSDSLGVLFVLRADDVTGTSRRQITEWRPPSGSSP